MTQTADNSFDPMCDGNRTYAAAHPEVMRIDVEQVIRQRVPKIAQKLPGAAFRFVEWLICQDDLNRLLAENAQWVDAEFCKGVFRSLDVSVEIENPDALPPSENRRITFVSNHPLGGLDGMALIAALADRYGGKVYFIVNDLLMAVKPLNGVFVPVNKYGRQQRQSLTTLESVFEQDIPIVIFPAGLVSRLRRNPDRKWWNPATWLSISDLKWQKSFLARSRKSMRDIVPLHFSGRNRLRFYIAARVRKALGIKFNIEMILLPSELVASKGKKFKIKVGERLPWQQISDGSAMDRQAENLRRTVASDFKDDAGIIKQDKAV